MTKRFYTGARSSGKTMGEAARLKRLEIEKGGKLPFTPQERYRRILKEKMAESRKEAAGKKPSFNLPGAIPLDRKMSKKTEEALRQISMRKAMKEEKALRKMVVVQPRIFSDAGRIDAKGNAYDLGNNLTLKVDRKTGKIKTQTGWTVGKYSNKKKFMTNMLLTENLKKHGAYFLQQKRLQMLQEQARLAALQEEATRSFNMASQIFLDQHYGTGSDAHGNQLNNGLTGVRGNQANVSAWGVMSGNVHGTFAENAWGGMADNVWGGVNNNVWGGMGGSAWGSHRGWKIWGSGKPGQKNYLKPLGALFVGFFGIGMGKGLGRLRLGGRSGSGSSGRSSGRSR